MDVRILTVKLSFLILCAANAYALRSPFVLNAAAYYGEIAPSSMMRISFDSVPAPPWNPALVKVTVQPRGSNQTFECKVIDWKADILAIAPPDLPIGPATLTLSINGTTWPTTDFEIVSAGIGLFEYTPLSFFNGGLAQNIDALGKTTLNRLSNPALPGQYITLWGTGIGNLSSKDITVDVAGIIVPPLFAGHSAQYPGVDQINFQLPLDAINGCYVPVKLRFNAAESNPITIAKAAAAGACEHPLGLTPDELKTLDAGGAIPFGSFSLGSGTLGPGSFHGSPFFQIPEGYIRSESVQAGFGNSNMDRVRGLSGVQEPDSVFLSCRPFNGNGLGAGIFRGPEPGIKLILNGPAGQQIDIPGRSGQYFWFLNPTTAPTASSPDLLPRTFTPGTWTLNSNGDDTLAPFKQSFQLPPAIRWTNKSALTTISRDALIEAKWDPSGYLPDEIFSFSVSGGGQSGFSCNTPATTGTIRFPLTLIQQLTPTATGQIDAAVSIHPLRRQQFKAPLANGNFMRTVLSYSIGDLLPVVIK